jgi:hypothetical protein
MGCRFCERLRALLAAGAPERAPSPERSPREAYRRPVEGVRADAEEMEARVSFAAEMPRRVTRIG